MNILGQDFIIRYLNQGLKTKRLSPSLLFTGQDGLGKRTIATELGKALLCENPKHAPGQHTLYNCDACLSCQKITENIHPDFLLIDYNFQATSQSTIKIESIRHVLKFLSFKPLEGTKRVIVIDEAHTLTNEAANALLKILEEPPPDAQLILLAKDERNLPSTILSRCAILHFKPLSTVDVSQWLIQQKNLPFDEAEKLAHQSNGSLSKVEELIEDDDLEFKLTDYSLIEFFELMSQPSFRREGRKKAEKIVSLLIDQAQKELENGDLNKQWEIESLLQARKQIDRYISPRLVLENLFLTLQKEGLR